MRTLAILSVIILLLPAAVPAQKYVTKSGHIRFFSTTAIENIEGNNKAVNSAIDAATGDIVFQVLMKSFEFDKALMQEHFNENYAESDKYPNSVFKGKITNLKDIDFTKPGTYNALVEGDLTLHGVTKKIKENGTLELKGDQLITKSKFKIKPADYNIKIPAPVAKQVAESIEVSVNATLNKYNP